MASFLELGFEMSRHQRSVASALLPICRAASGGAGCREGERAGERMLVCSFAMPRRWPPRRTRLRLLVARGDGAPRAGTCESGFFTGGGDVPGLNHRIKALAVGASEHGWEVFGIRRGWRGLLNFDPDGDETENASWVDQLQPAQTRTIDRSGGNFHPHLAAHTGSRPGAPGAPLPAGRRRTAARAAYHWGHRVRTSSGRSTTWGST